MQHNFEQDSDPAIAEPLAADTFSGEAEAVMSPDGELHWFVARWRAFSRWFQTMAFSPGVLPAPWSHPAYGYLSAVLGQVVAVSVIVWLTQSFPIFRFPSAFTLLVILLVALGWGVGPSVVATLMGAVLLSLLLIPPYFSLALARVEDMVSVLLYVSVGLTIGILTSQTQRARHISQATAEYLEAIIEALPDPLVLYDAEGRAIQFNQTARETVSLAQQQLSLAQMPQVLDLRGMNSQPLSLQEFPVARALKGERVSGLELSYQPLAEGHKRIVSVSAAPIRSAVGASIVGAVTVTHDLSGLRQTEQEATRRAQQLEALFTSITDGVTVYDQQGRLVQMNPAARAFFAQIIPADAIDAPMEERVLQMQLFQENMTAMPLEQTPVSRILRGEVLTSEHGVDLRVRTLDGRVLWVNVTGAPMYNAASQIIGGVAIMRDVTERQHIEEALRKSEEQYRTIVQTANEGIWLVDRRGHTTYANDRMAALLGFTPSELIGKHVLAFVFPEDEAQGRARMGSTLRGNVEQFEFRFRRTDGSSLYAVASTSPVRDASGTVVGALGLFTDITARKQTELALQLSEERLRVALQNSSITVYQQDQNLRYTWMHNPLPTFTPEMILGKTDAAFLLPEEAEYLMELKRRVLTSGEGMRQEIRATSDVGVSTLELTIEPLREMSGAIIGVTGTAIDMTEHKRAEEERLQLLVRTQQSEYRFQRLFNANLVGLLVVNHEHIFEANDAFLKMVGYTRADLEAGLLHWREMTPPEYMSLNEQAIKDLTTRGECQPFEKEYFRKDGSRVPILIGAVTIEEEPLRWISFVLDLSERKRLEQESKSRARELEALFEAMTDGIFVYDTTGKLQRLNTAARTLLSRYIASDDLSIPVQERAERYGPRSPDGQPLPPDQIPSIRILSGEVLTGANMADVLMRTFEGEDLWLNMSGTQLRDEQGRITGAIAIARDVTERRQLEQRTRTALESLLEMAQVMVQGSEVEQEIISGSRDAEVRSRKVMQRMAELTREVLGCRRLGFTRVEPETELLRPLAVVGLPPEQEQQWWRKQEEQEVRLGDGADPALIEQLRANELLLLDLSQPPYNELPNPYGIREMLTAPMVLGTRLLGFLTMDYGGLDHTYTPDEMALTRAVTKLAALTMERDRLLAETAQARANELAAREAARLKDEFIGIASHELRTPMTSMKANLQLAGRQLRRFLQQHDGEVAQALGQVPQFVERTERQLERQQRLVRDLLDASRVETGHLELHSAPCDLLVVLRETVDDQQQVTPNRTIELDLPSGDAVMVMADSDRVSQVISNYLSNALKYSEATYPITVSLEVRGTEARIAVRDQGPGLSEEQLLRIWERFYRVPEIQVRSGSGVGLGLGLHISRTIIERQGGTVGVESEQGKGSTFWFTLPVLERGQEEGISQPSSLF